MRVIKATLKANSAENAAIRKGNRNGGCCVCSVELQPQPKVESLQDRVNQFSILC